VRPALVVTLVLGVAIVLLLALIFLSPRTGDDPGPQPQPLCRGTARCLNSTVDRVIDGDTLEVGGSRVRLTIIDAPELGEANYSQAIAYLSGLCPVGAVAIVDEDDYMTNQTFGLIAKVTCNGQNVNGALLAAGFAVTVPSFCAISEFSDESWTTC
jgi:endonuclease YncB( thermonuclease family)